MADAEKKDERFTPESRQASGREAARSDRPGCEDLLAATGSEAFMAAPDAMFLVDGQGRFHNVNRAACEALGYAREELLSMGVGDIVTERQVERLELIQDLLEKRGRLEFDDVHCRKDGSCFPVEVFASYYEAPGFKGHISIARDMSRRARAEEALRESEAVNRAIIDSSSDCVKIIGVSGELLFMNRGGLALLGVDDPGRVLGRSYLSLWKEPERSLAAKAVADAFSGRHVSFGGETRDEGGRVRRWDVALSPIVDNQGAIDRILGISRDVTDKYQAREALERRQRMDAVMADLYRRLLAQSDLGAAAGAILDAAMDLCRAAEGCLGAKDPVSGRFVLYAATPAMEEVFKTSGESVDDPGGLLGRALRSGAAVIANASETSTNAGREKLGHFLSVPVMEKGRVVGEAALARAGEGFGEEQRDILDRLAGAFVLALERRAYEDELLRAKEEAERANSAKSEFLARMSHEIRTPMNAILNMSEIAMYASVDEEQRDYLHTVRESAGRLLAIINDILDLSKVEAGKLELETVDFNLRDILHSSIGALGHQAAGKGLRLDLRLAGVFPRFVRGDPLRLRQILINLAGNAVKFTRTGGVVVTASCHGASCPAPIPGREKELAGTRFSLHFSIKDTGPGVPENMREYVFGRFNQADGSISRRHGGTGLGLAISKELVERMGGSIWLESPPEGGADFHFVLPLEAGDPDAVQAAFDSGEEALAPPAAPLRILLAEDNEQNVKVARLLLRRLGHDPVVARTGVEALAALAGADFDLAFLDVEMPDMDGLETARRLRAGEAEARNRDIPLAAVTAHAISGYREKCLEAGMTDYVSKPFSIHDLARVLSRASPSRTQAPPIAEAGGEPAAGKEAPGAPMVVDREAALSRFDGDEALYAEFVRDFLAVAPGKLEALRKNFADRDAGLRIQAHAFKGAAGAVGADRIVAAAQRLEDAAKDADWAAADAAMAELEEQWGPLRRALTDPARPGS